MRFDLQKASQDKVQATENGLVVLEEKQTLLQWKYDDLESTFEKGKYEISKVEEQISLLQTKSDTLAQQVEHKQDVQECSTRESGYPFHVSI